MTYGSGAPVHRIRAAVLRRRGGPLQMEDLVMEGPREDEVMVRIVATGICHTDIGMIDTWSGTPVVLGHEGAGIVEYAGRAVRGVQPGDHVVLSYQSCGECRPCRDGLPSRCRHFLALNFGFQRRDGSNALQGGVRGHFFGQSSFATHVLATERNLVAVSEELPLEVLAPLGCGLQTGAGTVLNALKVPPGAGVAVFGTGAVGLAAVMAARAAGADPVIGVDVNPARLATARELGATHVIDNRREDIVARIEEIAGGVDYVLEITGHPEMEQRAVDALRPGGTVALVAGPGDARTLPGGRRVIEIIQGDAVPQQFIPRMIAMYRAGRFPFERLEKLYDFREINQAVSDARRGVTIKPVLRVGGE